MKKQLLAVLTGLSAGVLGAFMMRLNALLGMHIGALESAFVVHLAGFLFGLVLLVLFSALRPTRGAQKIPPYLFFLGFVGILVVVGSNLTVVKVGMVLSVGLFITGNLVFGMIADHFGLMGLPVRKMNGMRFAGLVCALTGLFLIL
ncbi:MAG: DMT family transporter [Deltaproteobacteria bacterium]|nr:DMT family transporter [Deltaproteobacteria bacterium]